MADPGGAARSPGGQPLSIVVDKINRLNSHYKFDPIPGFQPVAHRLLRAAAQPGPIRRLPDNGDGRNVEASRGSGKRRQLRETGKVQRNAGAKAEGPGKPGT